ncbi:MAG TPA: hypothetical protein VI461_02765, partial [Chitinophagaceae bacterium]|nr:hypothetical protein [Chitinophagaceae bacterium]
VPVFGLSRFEANPGISIVATGKNYYVAKIIFASMDAGASYFSLQQSYVLLDRDGKFRYSHNDKAGNEIIPYHKQINKDGGTVNFDTLFVDKPITSIFIWLRGSYKRLDGTGDFSIDEVYEYDLADKSFTWVSGETKKKVISIVVDEEK